MAQKYIAGLGVPSGLVTAHNGGERAVHAGLEHGDHRDDGQENAGEQLLPPASAPGELVVGVHAARRHPQRNDGDDDQADVAHDTGQANLGARDVEDNIGLPQEPLISTSATTPPSSRKLTAPSKPNRLSSGVGSLGLISSLLW